jgi:gluconokinase
MAAGHPLTDDDRWPWLASVADAMRRIESREGNTILACSALRQVYRDRLATAGDVRFVHLQGDYDTISSRLAARSHRYMPASLLASQFAALEPPVDALTVDVREPVAAQVEAIRSAFSLTRDP